MASDITYSPDLAGRKDLVDSVSDPDSEKDPQEQE